MAAPPASRALAATATAAVPAALPSEARTVKAAERLGAGRAAAAKEGAVTAAEEREAIVSILSS